MTDTLRDRIVQIILTTMHENRRMDWSKLMPRVADAIIAALPDMVAELEWIEAGSDFFDHDADFVDTSHTYQIQEGVFWYAAQSNGTSCGTNAKAKAAANAHHVAQIMAAFGIAAAGGEGE